MATSDFTPEQEEILQIARDSELLFNEEMGTPLAVWQLRLRVLKFAKDLLAAKANRETTGE